MDVMTIFSFLGAAVLLTLMPGPDILFVIAQSISQNKKAGIATSLGLCSGLVVHISAASLGISAIIYQSALAFSIVKYAGAAYLLVLAWKSFREKESDFTMGHTKPSDYKSLYRRGIWMNVLNPKVSLFFVALLPQFIDKSSGYIPVQMIILGFIFIIQAIIIFTLVSLFADKIRGLLLNKPSIAKRINNVKGLLLGYIGLQIAFSERSSP
ncbi:LysE family translocator [Paenibacillus tarimensis]